MRKHLTDGELRAALDDELEFNRLHHLEVCTACQARKGQLQGESQETARLLAFLVPADEPTPNAQSAWHRFSQEILIKKEISMFKKWFAFPVVRFGSALALILALILAFPARARWLVNC